MSDHLAPDDPAPDPTTPLRGTRILDFTVNAAGPYATWLLANLGADVIKVESFGRTDPTRGSKDRPYIHSSSFDDCNTGKRSVAIDLKTPTGRQAALDLAVEMDVVVSSFRPGVMERLGLDAGALHERNPQVVVAAFSATGSSGPYAGLPGYAGVFNALGGLGGLTGYEGGPPTELRTSIDFRAGALFAAMIVNALRQARLTGVGGHIDFSATEAVATLAGEYVTAALLGASFEQRTGNRDELWAPQGTYGCRCGAWVALTVRDDAEWARLAAAMRSAGIDVPASFDAIDARHEHADALDVLVSQWTSTLDRSEALAALHAAGIAAAPVLDASEVAHDPHLAARSYFAEIDAIDGGRGTVAAAPWLADGHRPLVGAARPLGADTADVLREVLSLAPERATEMAVGVDAGAAVAAGGGW